MLTATTEHASQPLLHRAILQQLVVATELRDKLLNIIHMQTAPLNLFVSDSTRVVINQPLIYSTIQYN